MGGLTVGQERERGELCCQQPHGPQWNLPVEEGSFLARSSKMC